MSTRKTQVYFRRPSSFYKKKIEIKDLGEGFGIQIHCDRNPSLLGFSQESYIKCVLKRFNMHSSLINQMPIEKRNKLDKQINVHIMT